MQIIDESKISNSVTGASTVILYDQLESTRI